MANNTLLMEKIITAKTYLSRMKIRDNVKETKVNQAQTELDVSATNLSEKDLIGKIVNAKIHLEDLHFDHTCMLDIDLEYTGSCTCGADANSTLLEKAKKVLNLS